MSPEEARRLVLAAAGEGFEVEPDEDLELVETYQEAMRMGGRPGSFVENLREYLSTRPPRE